MKLMTSPPVEPADLLDLKLLPAWVKQPAEPKNYEHYTGEEESGHETRDHGLRRGKRRPRTSRNREQPSSFGKSRAGIQQPAFTGDRRHRDPSRRKTGGSERGPHKAKGGRPANR